MAAFQLRQDYAYDYLRDMIINGKIEDDKIYSGTVIAQEIGISRTPVRDALQRLSQDGYIEVLPTLGFRINKLTGEEIVRIVQMRCAIESYCAEMLSQDILEGKPVDQTLSVLVDCMERLEELQLKTETIPEFVRLDKCFHSQIVTHLNNPLFGDLYEKYMFMIERFLVEVMHQPRRMEDTIMEHHCIYQAILCGDFSRIAGDMRAHINKAADLVLQSKADGLCGNNT